MKKTKWLRISIGIAIFIVLILSLPYIFGTREPKRKKVFTDVVLSQIESALLAFVSDCGQFPSESQGLDALKGSDDLCKGKNMHWPYLNKPYADGWGKNLIFKNDGKAIVVGSSGGSENINHLAAFFECQIETKTCEEHFFNETK